MLVKYLQYFSGTMAIVSCGIIGGCASNNKVNRFGSSVPYFHFQIFFADYLEWKQPSTQNDDKIRSTKNRQHKILVGSIKYLKNSRK